VFFHKLSFRLWGNKKPRLSDEKRLEIARALLIFPKPTAA